MATPLNRSRPLWQIDVVHQVDPSATVLVWRVHHCMADGVTVMHLAEAVLWDDGTLDTQAPPPTLDRLARVLDAHPPADERTEHHWHHPLRQFARLVPMLRRELAPAHIQPPLARHVGPRREVAFATVPLARVKDLAHRAGPVSPALNGPLGPVSPALNGPLGPGVTVNDVVLTAVGGALRTWLAGQRSPAVGLRAQVPVSLHHHDPRAELSANRDSFMFVDLDVQDPDPRRRLLAISAQTREREQSQDAEALDAFLHDLGRVSRHLQDLALHWSMSPREFAVNVSNVPGPNRPLSVVGAPVVAVYSLAEVADRHALRIAAISAAGTLSFGLCGDPEVIEGIDRLARGIESELDSLAAELRAVQP